MERSRFLVPSSKDYWDFDKRENWDSEWTGSLAVGDASHAKENIGMLRAWVPYMLVAALLVATRVEPHLADWVKNCAISLEDIFGTTIDHALRPLYLPGTVFIVVSLLTFCLHGMNAGACRRAFKKSAKTLMAASVALVFTVPMVQVFINSGGGEKEYERMPIALAEGTEMLVGNVWPLIAPIIGGIGAAVAGSNTISNMMFSLFQFNVGSEIGVDPTWVVALQAVGGAAGNTICVHNVVAASAVVGLIGKEGAIIRKTLIAFLYYALLSGALGYSIVWTSTKGLFNIGSAIALLIAVAAIWLIATNRRRLDAALSPEAK